MAPLLAALISAAAVSGAHAAGLADAAVDAPDSIVLPVPQRSQVDGTIWASSNCGPAAIAMVLEAYGQLVTNQQLRDRANQLLGIASPNTGTRVQDLARVVQERGFSVRGPYDGKQPHRWTLDEVRQEIRDGRPVVAQVYFPLLPNHRDNPINTDHYIVIVGISGEDFIFNDSADSDAPGYHQTMTAEQFTRAWGASGVPFGGFSVGPGSGGTSLLAVGSGRADVQARGDRSSGILWDDGR